MKFFKPRPTIAVHDGKFHADDIFAAATLQIVLGGRGRIVRTRDQAVIDRAEYVADVGGINDPATNRFDHHMPEGGGVRDNGIPYASFGLVWKKFGEQVSGSKEIADRIEAKLVCPIDADDSGVSLVASTNAVTPYGFHSFLYSYRPTWKEDQSMHDASFLELVEMAKRLILREAKIASDALEAQSLVVNAYSHATDKRVIELAGSYPYQEILVTYSEPLYVVGPRADGKWKVETVRKNPFGFESRKPLPQAWAGLRDTELAKATGVADAIFCHRNLFLAVAGTREGALALAKIALGIIP